MKKLTSFFSLLLYALLLLTACGQTPGTTAPATKSSQQMIIDASRSYFQFDIKPIEVSHGEDYVIEWQDAGMEAHIRFLLDKPKGDILHSDVWDVQILLFDPLSGIPHDVMLTKPLEGWDSFFWETIIYNKYQDEAWHSYGFHTFPNIQSLADLRHFDSLQLLDITGRMTGIIDPAGLENCVHMKKLFVENASEQLLNIAAGLTELEILTIESENEVDLSPLAGHPSLRTLRLANQQLTSLEPLATIPKLRALNLDEAVFPDLEPLTQTNLEALSMGLSQSGRGTYSDLDYEPLSRIETLVHLDLVNHTAFDADDCDAILEDCTALKYLDFSYTSAADAYASGDWTPDLSHLEAYQAAKSR